MVCTNCREDSSDWYTTWISNSRAVKKPIEKLLYSGPRASRSKGSSCMGHTRAFLGELQKQLQRLSTCH